MNKMTKKLFAYFTTLLAFFAVTAFMGFLGVFRYFTYQHLEHGLKERAEAIQRQLEQFLHTPGSHGYGQGQGQGRGAYLRFVDDIAMADVYILDADGQPYTCGRNGQATKLPTDDVLEFSARIFSSGQYTHMRTRAAGESMVFYVGVPVAVQGETALTVIIRDQAAVHQESFVLAISILGGCMLLALLCSGVLSVFLSRWFLQPIQQIASTTKELARGNYLATTHVHDRTELGELAEEVDLLAQKLEAARRESSRMEQMQKDYISNISHELRTPVTVIRSSLEAVCDGVVTGEKAEEYQRQMLTECISLQRLINDMLELSRLQNLEFPIEKERIDLQMTLEDAIRAVRVLAREKSICIRLEREREEFLMEGDYGRLRQMFVAALENAIKYSPAGSEVLASVQNQSEFFVITIRDYGCGIPEQELEHIFEKFYRCRQNREKGSGLGLAIMKSIADRHGIKVRLQNAAGGGTAASFMIGHTAGGVVPQPGAEAENVMQNT